MEPTISRFLLFIGSELLFCIATFLIIVPIGIMIMKNKALKNEYAIFIMILATIISTVFFILVTWILTGEHYFWLFMILAGTAIGSTFIVELLWLIFRPSNVPWFGRLLWAGYEFKELSPNISKFLQLCSALTLLVFPIYIGFGYFGEAFGNNDWPKYVIRSTIVVLIGMSWLTQLPTSLYLMVSKNIKEASRSRLFINLLGNSVSVLLFISLFIWTIQVSETTPIPFLGEPFVFSPTVGYATIVYLLVVVIIPYVIGHYRAMHWDRYLEEKRKGFINKLSQAFMSPNHSKAISSIEEIKSTVEEELERLEEDKSIVLARQTIECDDIKLYVPKLGLLNSIDRDPRFIYYDNLNGILNQINECKLEIEEKTHKKDKEAVLEAYLKSLNYQEKLQKSIDSDSKPWVLIGITSLVSAMLNPIISSATKIFAAAFVPYQ